VSIGVVCSLIFGAVHNAIRRVPITPVTGKGLPVGFYFVSSCGDELVCHKKLLFPFVYGANSSFQTGMDTFANHHPKCPDNPEDFACPSASRGLLFAL
jgi:hypothetical protein